VLTCHRSHGRIDIFSQVFDNSQRNSLRGVDTGFLSVLPLLHGVPNFYKSGIVIRYRSPQSFDLVFRNGGTCKRRSIHTLCPRCAPHPVLCSFSSARKRIPIPALFLSACAPANSISFVLQCRVSACRSVSFVLRRRVSACRSVSFVLGAQAQADAILLCPSAPRKRMPIRFL